MGKGSLNRLLLSKSDLTTATTASLVATDPRAIHIRTILQPAYLKSPAPKPLTLRIAVEQTYLHDAANATIKSDGSIDLCLPLENRRPVSALPPVLLIVAMQRPKVMARVLTFAASLGVQAVCVVATDKVEKSYWDCKLFRSTPTVPSKRAFSAVESDDADDDARQNILPGRPRGPANNPAKDRLEQLARGRDSTRVDELLSVRAKLLEGVQQACMDAELPRVYLERRGISALLDPDHPLSLCAESRHGWTRMLAHPDSSGALITKIKPHETLTPGAVLAIGPEGGWTDEEVAFLEREAAFNKVSLGDRVLRSETAVVVALGLVHEWLRVQEQLDEEDVAVQ